jgi:N-acetylglucosaminyldiphosphoundecaprenol N-acetyl-beta-D-mannosaminyltransferase
VSRVVSVLGYNVFSHSLSELAEEIDNHLKSEVSKAWLCCLNPHSYAVSKNLLIFRDAIRSATWVIPDGIGLVMAGNFLSQPVQERITGSNTFNAVSSLAERSNYKVFFLGASEEILQLISEKYRRDFPGSEIVGTYSPPYKNEFSCVDIDFMVESVNNAGADILWVGMTSPKQDIFIAQNIQKLNVRFAAGIGAVFDFYAEQTPRASDLMIRMRLEWFHRFLMSPKRMWKRIFVSGPIFLLDVMKARFIGKKS